LPSRNIKPHHGALPDAYPLFPLLNTTASEALKQTKENQDKTRKKEQNMKTLNVKYAER
jgi:hypothetical protein